MITKERAQEIIDKGWQWSNYSEYMTQPEISQVMDYWRTLPGWTCFYDALSDIAKGSNRNK